MKSEYIQTAVKTAIYEFGEFRLDACNLLLTRNSETLALAPKACEVLLALVENANRVVTKQELIEAVWKNTIVEEANLTHHISALRKVLGEEKNGRKFIETIPRRGYRFVAPIEKIAANAVEIIVSERTKTHLIEEIEIENEPEIAKTGQIPEFEPRNSPRSPKMILVFAASLAVLLVGAGSFWAFFAQKKQNIVAPRLIPVTSFTGHELSPAISPDGKLVAYCGAKIKNESPNEPYALSNFNIYVKQADGESVLQLTDKPGRAMTPVWSPDGRFIAYAQIPNDGTVEKNFLFIIPALGGAEQKIYEAPHLSSLDWSPDGKTLVFSARSEQNAPNNLFAISLETREVRQITFSADDNFTDPDFSPDGKMISFVRVKNKMSEIYVVPLAGGEPQQILTNAKFIIGRARWTPDGENLIFGSNRSGNYRLWKVSTNGGEPELVNGAGEPATDPSLSADGSRLAYLRMEIDFNIWRVPLENNRGIPERAEKIIASFRRDRCPAISPDGRRISFVSNQSGAAQQVWTADADGKNQRQLTDFPDGSVATRAAWSPDGKFLAFDAAAGTNNSAIYVLNVESGVPQKITDDAMDSIAPSWSSDGKFVYFAQKRDEQWQVWKIPATGGEAIQVTKNGGYEARESADGKFVYFNKAGYGALGIFRQPANGSAAEERILDLHQFDSVGEWTPTEKGIYYFHRTDVFDVPSKQPRIRFFDFATGQSSDVSPLPRNPFPNPGLGVSPDGKWLYYSLDDKADVDVMLLENFE